VEGARASSPDSTYLYFIDASCRLYPGTLHSYVATAASGHYFVLSGKRTLYTNRHTHTHTHTHNTRTHTHTHTHIHTHTHTHTRTQKDMITYTHT
jgi:hypothetical protein